MPTRTMTETRTWLFERPSRGTPGSIITLPLPPFESMERVRLNVGCMGSLAQTQTYTQIDRQTDGQKDRQTERETDRQTDKQTDRQTDRQTNGQTDRQTDRRTDGHRHIQTGTGTRYTWAVL